MIIQISLGDLKCITWGHDHSDKKLIDKTCTVKCNQVEQLNDDNDTTTCNK
jgi:hypothetical protein